MADRRAGGFEAGPEPERRAHALKFAAGVLTVAALAAAFAIVFRFALGRVLALLTAADDVVSAMRGVPIWLRVAVPAVGGLLSGSVSLLLARSGQGGGVSDVMEAVVLGNVRLPLRATLLKSLASWLAIAAGASLGREGPLIQFGGAAGKWTSDRLGLPFSDARRLIAAGTAAGFAAAYNTPFAAVLFVLEIVTGVVVLQAMVPVLVATVIACACTRWLVGEGPVYGLRAFALHSPMELIGYAFLGIVGAIAAQFFMLSIRAAERMFHRSGLGQPWRAALGGLLTGSVIAFLPEVAGNGYEPLNEILDGRLAAPAVILLVVAKALATSASVGSGSPGGVFTPTLMIGGGVGYVMGALLCSLFGPQVGAAGSYALVGMAVTTAASTHAPLMSAVMAFELAGDYAIALPLCLATAVATATSRALRKDSIYTAELTARGVAWELSWDGRRSAKPAKRGDEPSR
ncbi:MAG TPA: chloride channel protein [Polyangiales bacterium]|nr:chloride channel protein [Polyangiales bacterium]